MPNSFNATFNKSKDKVYHACLLSIATLGYTVKITNKEDGVISFESGLSMKSWEGQQLSCTIVELGKNQSQLFISGAAKQEGHGTFDIFGEAASIAKDVINSVAKNLGESADIEDSLQGNSSSTLVVVFILAIIIVSYFLFSHSSSTSDSNSYTNPTNETTQTIKTGKIISTKGLNMHREANSISAVLTTIPYNESVNIIEISDNNETIGGRVGKWYKVKYADKEGWIFSSFVELNQ